MKGRGEIISDNVIIIIMMTNVNYHAVIVIT